MTELYFWVNYPFKPSTENIVNLLISTGIVHCKNVKKNTVGEGHDLFYSGFRQ